MARRREKWLCDTSRDFAELVHDFNNSLVEYFEHTSPLNRRSLRIRRCTESTSQNTSEMSEFNRTIARVRLVCDSVDRNSLQRQSFSDHDSSSNTSQTHTSSHQNNPQNNADHDSSSNTPERQTSSHQNSPQNYDATNSNETMSHSTSDVIVITTDADPIQLPQQPFDCTRDDDDADVVFISHSNDAVAASDEVIDLSTPVQTLHSRSRRPRNASRPAVSINSLTADVIPRGPNRLRASIRRNIAPSYDAPQAVICSVCMDSPVNRAPTSTKCGHVFCEECIKTAVRLTHKCPLCNSKINAKQLIRLYL